MKFTKQVETEVEVVSIRAEMGVRYWNDATVNGVEGRDDDEDDGEDDPGIPCRKGDMWVLLIDIATGTIMGWPQGTTAEVHYKVCDAGIYTLINDRGNDVAVLDGYVPKTMCPEGGGYGDYVKMKIDADGKINKWSPDLSEWSSED